jgi:hypothetical protein
MARVFVLNVGRVGSKTFIAAAQAHITNHTAGHETRWGRLADRLDYPDRHIEADNRLSWFLGPLASRYPDAQYVHLRRDPADVIASVSRRWPDQSLYQRLRKAAAGSGSKLILPAFASGVLSVSRPTPAERVEVARLLVESVTENISDFLRDRPHVELWIDALDPAKVDEIWVRAGFEGDRAGFLGALADRVRSKADERLR